MLQPAVTAMFDHIVFIVQPYVAKPHRLVAEPARVFHEEADAKRAGVRLARYRAGVVVMAQAVNRTGPDRSRPHVLATHGRVPEGWAAARAA